MEMAFSVQVMSSLRASGVMRLTQESSAIPEVRISASRTTARSR